MNLKRSRKTLLLVKMVLLILCLLGGGFWFRGSGAEEVAMEKTAAGAVPEIDRSRPETETALFALG